MFSIKRIVIRDFPESRKLAAMSRTHTHDSEETPGDTRHDGSAAPTRLQRILRQLVRPAAGEASDNELSAAAGAVLDQIRNLPAATPAQTAAGGLRFDDQPEIFVVGDQPVYRGKDREPLLHEVAENTTSTELSFGRQDVLVYESDGPFAVDFHPMKHVDGAPRSPFYRDDLPFVARYDATDRVYRVVAGCITRPSVNVQHYKATIYLDGRRTVDPDVWCSP